MVPEIHLLKQSVSSFGGSDDDDDVTSMYSCMSYGSHGKN